MDELRLQQIEALKMGKEYIEKLIPAIREIIPELRGERMPDTQDFLNQIVDAINFVIEIVNATMPFINEKEEILNKDGIEEKVQELSDALGQQNDDLTAHALETGILPFIEIFAQVADVIIERG